MSPPWGRLRQPDQRSCGASVLVVARMLHDPAYAAAAQEHFPLEVLATHRRVTRPVLHGRAQVPWPRTLGTPPWAVARELSALTGRRHLLRPARWQRLTAGSAPAALYVGSRCLPRHVVLVLDASPRTATLYDPATGDRHLLRREALEHHRLPFGRWRRAWWVVVPALEPTGDRGRCGARDLSRWWPPRRRAPRSAA